MAWNPEAEGVGGVTLSIDLPLRLVNASNRREHWAARAKRAKTQRVAARLAAFHAAQGRGACSHG